MSLGLGIFLAAIVLGGVWLFKATMDRWNWGKVIAHSLAKVLDAFGEPSAESTSADSLSRIYTWGDRTSSERMWGYSVWITEGKFGTIGVWAESYPRYVEELSTQ